MNYQTFQISPDFMVEIEDSAGRFELSAADEALANQLWEEEQKQHEGTLFNGKMLSFTSFVGGKLKGRFIEYKYYRAQLRSSELKTRLNIRPIAISCSCHYKNEILIGQRSQDVTDFPGYYELVPSGGISLESYDQGKIDPKKQALIELEEEAAISSQWVKTCVPVILIYDIHAATFEIYMEIKLQEKGELTASTKEYTKLQWMALPEILAMAERAPKAPDGAFVPLSLFLIERYLKDL